MIFFPLSLIALAAGVYLLIKVRREFLGGMFSFLAWLIIVLSLLAIGYGIYGAIHKFGHRVEKEVIIRKGDGGGCHNDNNNSCHKGSGNDGCGSNKAGCNMGGCTVEGDSVVMTSEACEKLMGKAACDALVKERGRCIVSKDECMKVCHTGGKKCCAKTSEN